MTDEKHHPETVKEWIDLKNRERGWQDADLARAAEITSGSVSNAKERNSVGPKLARALAKGYGMREDDVFYELGLLQQKPGEVVIHDPVLSDLWRMILEMSENERIAARVLFDKMFGAKVDSMDNDSGAVKGDTGGRGPKADRKDTGKTQSK